MTAPACCLAGRTSWLSKRALCPGLRQVEETASIWGSGLRTPNDP